MQANIYTGGPRLLADIGGTNARFALETAPGHIEAVQTLACADHARFEDAVRAYLSASISGAGGRVRHAAIAIANPVDGDQIRMTNHHWAFSIEAARHALGLDTLLVVNDFTALAMSLPALKDGDLTRIGGGAAKAGGAIGLVGAGTGLGVSGLVPKNGRWIPLHSEGGHVAVAPQPCIFVRYSFCRSPGICLYVPHGMTRLVFQLLTSLFNASRSFFVRPSRRSVSVAWRCFTDYFCFIPPTRR